MPKLYLLFACCVFVLISSCATISNGLTNQKIDNISKTVIAEKVLNVTKDERMVSKVKLFLSKLDSEKMFSGSILISKKGKVLLSTGVGKANANNTNTEKTVYRIGSITKQFTAAAIMQLVEQNKIHLNDQISKYIPHSPKQWDEITVYQLLTHTSGIHNFTDSSEYTNLKLQKLTSDELIAEIENMPMDFRPGKKYKYSNSGYIILGKIIENITDEHYGDYLANHLFSVIGMNDSGYYNINTNDTDQAIGYKSDNSVEQYIDMSIPYAAGGLCSTVEDLFKWDCALSSDKILNKNSIHDMMSPHSTILNNTAYYGYGWMIGKRFGKKLITHGGGIECFSSQISKYVDDEITIIVLCNKANTSAGFIENNIAKIVFNTN